MPFGQLKPCLGHRKLCLHSDLGLLELLGKRHQIRIAALEDDDALLDGFALRRGIGERDRFAVRYRKRANLFVIDRRRWRHIVTSSRIRFGISFFVPLLIRVGGLSVAQFHGAFKNSRVAERFGEYKVEAAAPGSRQLKRDRIFLVGNIHRRIIEPQVEAIAYMCGSNAFLVATIHHIKRRIGCQFDWHNRPAFLPRRIGKSATDENCVVAAHLQDGLGLPLVHPMSGIGQRIFRHRSQFFGHQKHEASFGERIGGIPIAPHHHGTHAGRCHTTRGISRDTGEPDRARHIDRKFIGCDFSAEFLPPSRCLNKDFCLAARTLRKARGDQFHQQRPIAKHFGRDSRRGY